MQLIEFRPSSPEDEQAIVELLGEALGLCPTHPMVQSRHLHWKYWEEREDWRGSRSYVLTKGQRILAHGAVVPGSSERDGKRMSFVYVIDWAARSDSGGSGVTLMKRLGQMADASVAVDGSDLTRKILPFIGFLEHGEVTWFVRPVRPLSELTEISNWNWRLPARFGRNLFWSLSAPAWNQGAWSTRRVTLEGIGTARIQWPKSTAGTAVVDRTDAMFRYMLGCPACPVRLFAVERSGRTRGYFALAFAPAQARLIDFWMDSDDPSEWRALVELAVREAKSDAGVAEVISVCSDVIRSQALRNSGFHGRGVLPLLVRSRKVPAPGSIQFTMMDNDAAYLHDGRKQLLT